jgi:hypothetical protein
MSCVLVDSTRTGVLAARQARGGRGLHPPYACRWFDTSRPLSATSNLSVCFQVLRRIPLNSVALPVCPIAIPLIRPAASRRPHRPRAA